MAGLRDRGRDARIIPKAFLGNLHRLSGKIRRVELRKAEEARGENARGELEFFEEDFPELKG